MTKYTIQVTFVLFFIGIGISLLLNQYSAFAAVFCLETYDNVRPRVHMSSWMMSTLSWKISDTLGNKNKQRYLFHLFGLAGSSHLPSSHVTAHPQTLSLLFFVITCQANSEELFLQRHTKHSHTCSDPIHAQSANIRLTSYKNATDKKKTKKKNSCGSRL